MHRIEEHFLQEAQGAVEGADPVIGQVAESQGVRLAGKFVDLAVVRDSKRPCKGRDGLGSVGIRGDAAHENETVIPQCLQHARMRCLILDAGTVARFGGTALEIIVPQHGLSATMPAFLRAVATAARPDRVETASMQIFPVDNHPVTGIVDACDLAPRP